MNLSEIKKLNLFRYFYQLYIYSNNNISLIRINGDTLNQDIIIENISEIQNDFSYNKIAFFKTGDFFILDKNYRLLKFDSKLKQFINYFNFNIEYIVLGLDSTENYLILINEEKVVYFDIIHKEIIDNKQLPKEIIKERKGNKFILLNDNRIFYIQFSKNSFETYNLPIYNKIDSKIFFTKNLKLRSIDIEGEEKELIKNKRMFAFLVCIKDPYLIFFKITYYEVFPLYCLNIETNEYFFIDIGITGESPWWLIPN